MPHYYFHLNNGNTRPDMLGMTLPDRTAAKHEALCLAGGLLADPDAGFRRALEWSIDVVDQRGHGQFTLVFYNSLTEALAELEAGPDGAADE